MKTNFILQSRRVSHNFNFCCRSVRTGAFFILLRIIFHFNHQFNASKDKLLLLVYDCLLRLCSVKIRMTIHSNDYLFRLYGNVGTLCHRIYGIDGRAGKGSHNSTFCCRSVRGSVLQAKPMPIPQPQLKQARHRRKERPCQNTSSSLSFLKNH